MNTKFNDILQKIAPTVITIVAGSVGIVAIVATVSLSVVNGCVNGIISSGHIVPPTDQEIFDSFKHQKATSGYEYEKSPVTSYYRIFNGEDDPQKGIKKGDPEYLSSAITID